MCGDCGRARCGGKCGFSPSVLQINNQGCVFLRKISIPAALGDDSPKGQYAPYNGKYKNTIVEYKANGALYIYSSDGIYTKLLSQDALNKYATIIYSDEKDAEVLAEAKTHTDEKSAETLAEAESYTNAIASGKVDKEEGKGLSTNDYTNADKDKLASLGKTFTVTQGQTSVSYDGTSDEAIVINDPDLSAYYTKTETDELVAAETTGREEADNNLQEQIDALAAASDVVDIVGTYTDLQNYDTTSLNDNDIVKVLSDSTHDDATAYYRWDKGNSTWEYIGSEGPYYTKAETNTLLDDKQDKLTAGDNIVISPSGVISATGSGNTFSMELTQAEYDALTPEQKMNGTVYYITDGQGGGGKTYTGGNGIVVDNTNDTISADTTVLATKNDLPNEINNTDWSALWQ